MEGNDDGIHVQSGVITAATNSGTLVSSGGAGLRNSGTGTINSVANQAGGLIDGSIDGVLVESGSITTLSNSGTLDGGFNGLRTSGTLGTVTNTATGAIQGGSRGIYVEGGTLTTIANSGGISGTDTGSVVVGSSGVLGDATGVSGAALTSTGASALIDGTIQNEGTIYNGFTIENQSVTVSAGGGTTGSFTNGTLTVADGDLTFTEGTTTLAADVSVDAGSGTVFNQGTLDLLDSQTITGNFEQTGAAALSSGITDASTFGSLAISGTATFDGTLDLEQLLGFTLQDGQTFDLFSFASRSGGFSGLSVDGTPLSSLGTNEWAYGELTLTENWSGTAMSLSVAAVPEPSTLALAAAGIAGAAWGMVRRRTRA